MQNFIGYAETYNQKTRKMEQVKKECVANDRQEAARRMGVPLKTVCLER